MDNRPIGVYDSGMGGISLWKAIRHSLPNESIVYLGDGENCPYGEKDASQIIKFAFKAVETLMQYNCKMVVIACNTATSTAISELRAAYPEVPFVGMEPAIKPACMETKSGIVAVLATKRSLESDLFAETLSKYATGIEVVKQVGEGFVEIVEQGLEHTQESFDLVKSIVDLILVKDVDKIVLGCTHYPFLRREIEQAIADREIEIIEPSPAIVRRVEALLAKFDIKAEEHAKLDDVFITFADDKYRKRLISKAYKSII